MKKKSKQWGVGRNEKCHIWNVKWKQNIQKPKQGENAQNPPEI